MDWRSRTLSPHHEAPPKVHIRYPCPGLFRFAGMTGFLAVGLGIYYGGIELFGLPQLDMAAPAWTAKHVGLMVAGVLLGGMAGLLTAALAMTIEVRNERVSDLFIILWQYVANASIIWFGMIGLAMSIALGSDGAKRAVLDFGAERATLHVVATGCAVGLLLGAAFFLGPLLRLPMIGYLAFSITVSMVAARWHFAVYGIAGKAWMIAGVALPVLLLLVTPSMIARDRQQRRVMMEQSW